MRTSNTVIIRHESLCPPLIPLRGECVFDNQRSSCPLSLMPRLDPEEPRANAVRTPSVLALGNALTTRLRYRANSAGTGLPMASQQPKTSGSGGRDSAAA